MTRPRGERLYHRLPEIHRRRDREQGEPLRALLATIESQLEVLEDDVAGLYENWFLDTCQEWVVPYFADLLGVRGLGQPPQAGVHPRVQVARALEYRRRKGTPVALERATRDVTGWFARAVEMFEFLAHTQNVGHPRPEHRRPEPPFPWPGKGELFDLRRTAGVGREDDPFAPPALFHTVDVRRISAGRGRYNIPDIALHVWRLQAFPIADSPASAAEGVAGGFFFDPLGRDLRLFNRPRTPEEFVRLSDEHHLPVPLRRESVEDHLADYYGADRAFEIRVDGALVPAASVDIENLVVDDSGDWPAAPAAGRVQVDPESGRIRFGGTPPSPDKVRVSYLYGFAAGLGGGPYDRRATLADRATAGFYRKVSKRAVPGGLSLAEALSQWAADDSPRGIIRVVDSDVYDDALLDVALADGRGLVLEAANGTRPVLRPGTLQVTGTGAGRSFTLNGFLVDVEIKIANSLELLVTHTTLVPRPGRPNLTHTGDARDLKVRLTFSITGPLRLPDDIAELRIEDGILDAASTGGGATPLPALVSGPLSDPPNLGVSLELSIQLGTVAARTVTLARVPANVPDTATRLQGAIRAAAGGASDVRYSDAIVTVIGDRLLVRSGIAGEAVAVFPAAADPQTARDLALLVPPARALRGVLSGDLASFPVFAPLQVRVTLGGDGPHVAAFSGSPTTPAEAATQLQAAIRAARAQTVFTQATVTVLDDRLLVRPGLAGAGVAFAGSSADPQTVEDLALLSPPATRVDGIFSGRLVPFPVFPGPEVSVTIGGVTSVARLLGGSSPDLEDLADLLEGALHSARPAPFPDAEVLVLGNRLLVRRTGAGSAISFAATATDTATVAALALATPPAERLDNARLSTSLAPFPAFPRPRLEVQIAGDTRVVEMRRLAPDLGTARTVLEEAVRAAAGAPTPSPAFSGASVLLLGDRLLVRSGTATVEVRADGTDGTAAALALASDLAGTPQGLLSGEIGTLPSFSPPALKVSLGTHTVDPVKLTGFPRNIGEARTLIEEALRGASKETSFTKALVAAAGDRLFVASGVAGETVMIVAASTDPLTSADLALEAPPAVQANGLLSGELFPFPVLFRPTLQATIGSGPVGPRKVELASIPSDAATARPLLQAALRAAHSNPRFANATVTVLGDRLLVQPGVAGEAVTFAADADDANSVEDLGLLQPPARAVQGLLSGDLTGFTGLPRPRLRVTMTDSGGAEGPHLVSLSGFPADLDEAKTLLETALRTAASSPAFTGASVDRLGDQLVIQPGVAGAVVTVAAADTVADIPADTTTVTELGLDQPQAGFAGLTVSKIQVALGGTSASARFAVVPGTLAEAASRLEAAIRAASSNAAFTGATVESFGTRLLVTPGTAGAAVVFSNPPGAGTADRLALIKSSTGASDVQGLLSGPVSPVQLPPLAVEAHFDDDIRTVDLGALPTGVADLAALLENALRSGTPAPPPAFSGARVLVADKRILVLPGTQVNGITFKEVNAGKVVSQLKLDASAMPVRGLLSGLLAPFPVLRMAPAVMVKLGSVDPNPLRVALGKPASLEEVALLLEAGLRRDAGNPGTTRTASFTGARVRLLGGRLLVTSGSPAETVVIENTTGGPATASNLALTSGSAAAAAGWLAGPPFPVLRATSPQVAAKFDSTTRTVSLAQPADVADARDRLQTALVTIGFTGARVELFDERRLLVLSANGSQTVSFAATTADPDTAMQLGLAPPGAQAVTGLLSGPLTPFPTVSANASIALTLGTDGPHTIPLQAPGSLAEARTLLEAAIRQAQPGPSFVRARVLVTGDDRLLVLPGVAGEAVAIGNVTGGTTATELALTTAAGAVAAKGWLGSDPAAFSGLTAHIPRLDATLGGVTRTVALIDIPGTLADARNLLENALRPAFSGATVAMLADRLLVRSGTGAAVSFADVATGTETATLLGLAPGESGLLSGLLTGFTGLADDRPAIGVTIAGRGPFRATLAATPANVAQAAVQLQAALRAADGTATFTGASVKVFGERLLITPGSPQDAIAFSPAAGREEDLTRLRLDAASLVAAGGLLSGPLGSSLALRGLPRLQMRVQNGATSTTHVLKLAAYPADLAGAAALLAEALRPGFPLSSVEVLDGRRLLVSPGVAGTVSFEPVPGTSTSTADAASVVRLRLDSDQAVPADGLLSGRLFPFPSFLSGPSVLVQIGTEGPYRATLAALPASLEQARSGLEEAIRGAHTSPAFYLARVVLTPDRRLVVLPGRAGQVSFSPTPDDARTVDDLGLRGGGSLQVGALLSSLLEPAVDLTTATPGLHVALRSATAPAEDFDVTLTAAGEVEIEDLADALETAIRAAPPLPAAWVLRVGKPGEDGRLLVVPDTDGFSVELSATAADPTTVGELGFEVGSTLGGGTDDEAGPPLSLERVTVLGRVTVRELREASAVLFSQPLRVQRRHAGCVRYSYLPDGSETPRRFRCQPDLALTLAVNQALEQRARAAGVASVQQLPPAERSAIEIRERVRVLARLTPRFASTRFGDPGYAHLLPTTAPEILAGADDGSEIGAFHHLQEPARRRQLAILLEEYLRFGLDAGIFYVTESTE